MPPSTPPVLLIVDDDPDVLRALAFLGRARGYAVRQCASAAAAVEAASGDLACLVIDQLLPDMQGLDLLHHLRRLGVRTPAILITTAPSPVLVRQAAAADTIIVEKPLLDESLFDQIDRLTASGSS